MITEVLIVAAVLGIALAVLATLVSGHSLRFFVVALGALGALGASWGVNAVLQRPLPEPV